MRIALCIAGQPRVVERGFIDHAKPMIFDANPDDTIDVFIHNWFDEKDAGQIYVNAGGHVASDSIPQNVIEQMEKFYQPKKMLIQEQEMFEEKDYNDRKMPAIIPFYSLSRLNSVKRVNQLKIDYEQEHEFEYDLVISYRTDIGITEPVYFREFPTASSSVWHLSGCPHPRSINVVMVLGTSSIMNWYSELVDHVDSYYRDDNIIFCDEPLAWHHMMKRDIEPAKFYRASELLRG